MSLQVLLLDVEGTTTPITFVYDILFPYARQRLSAYCEQHAAELTGHMQQAGVDSGRELAEAAERAMDSDQKLGWLKELQGRIWESGYGSGEIRGSVFADVRPCFAAWKERGLDICIYSSGSVLAQRLLFKHSEAGDLTPWIRRYFDTAVGPKGEAESYRTIARELGIRPEDGLFATDVLREADAAAEAGWQVVILNRPGNPEQPHHLHPQSADFQSLLPTH